jgi:hypothetical protein
MIFSFHPRELRPVEKMRSKHPAGRLALWVIGAAIISGFGAVAWDSYIHGKSNAGGTSLPQKRPPPSHQNLAINPSPAPATDTGKKTDTDALTDSERADFTKFVSAAIAVRHGGIVPKTLSEADTEVGAKAAIKWKAKQNAEKAKRELAGMRVKPARSDGYAEIYIAKEAIKSALREPDSAVFGSNLFYVNDRKMNGYYVPVVCGSVSSKNGFGGMSGQKNFVFFPTLGGRLALQGSVPDAVIADNWNKMCAGKHD